MRKFIKHIVFFSIPIVLLMLLGEVFVTSEMLKSNRPPGEIEVWNDIYSGDLATDIAIYGSSRAWVHFSPEIITAKTGMSAYNFGMDGQNFDLQHVRHTEYFKYNKLPKTIVLSLDIFSLREQKELYGADQFLPYLFWHSTFQKRLKKYNYYKASDYYLPWVRYIGKNGVLKELAVNVIEDSDTVSSYRTRGYRSFEREWNNDLLTARLINPAYALKVDNSLKQLLATFIDDCNAKDVALVFVYAPEYIEGQSFVKNRAEIVTYYKKLAEKNEIPFLDYSSNAICKDKKYFYNATHLNRQGSVLFSEIFSEDLNEIFMK